MRFITAMFCGLVFGFGLILSGMTDPGKVLGFLDIFGNWNPSLALVMGGAIAVGVIGFALAKRRSLSWSGDAMQLSANTSIDAKLIFGGVLFGAGWGIAGFCPGPALVAASTGSIAALGFIGAMLVGMQVHDRLISGDDRISTPR